MHEPNRSIHPPVAARRISGQLAPGRRVRSAIDLEPRGLRRVLVTLLFVLLALPALATTLSSVKVVCPVCGTSVEAEQLITSNFFGGQDRDFLSRAAGTQPVLVYPITCPRCHHSGFLGDFHEKLTPQQKSRMLAAGALVVPAPPAGLGGRSDGLKAWQKYDLIVQTQKIRGRPERGLGDLYLKAAWAVRLEEQPFEQLLASLTEQDLVWLSQQSGGEGAKPGESEFQARLRAARQLSGQAGLRAARQLLGSLDGLPEARRRVAAIFVVSRLRDHGEHPELLAALPRLKPFLSAEWSTLEPQLKASVELERRYQRLSLAAFEQELAEPEVSAGCAGSKSEASEETKKKPRPVLLYLCGELARRLGEPDRARKFYEQAGREKEAPEWLPELLQEQTALLPGR